MAYLIVSQADLSAVSGRGATTGTGEATMPVKTDNEKAKERDAFKPTTSIHANIEATSARTGSEATAKVDLRSERADNFSIYGAASYNTNNGSKVDIGASYKF